ncbi:enoyl-CoA hydratase/isomerase family protein [Nonomuraea ferruginea]
MLASAADVSFAVPSARFGDAHVQVGLPAGNGPAALWPLLAGPQRAKRLLLGGEMISTDQAVAWGGCCTSWSPRVPPWTPPWRWPDAGPSCPVRPYAAPRPRSTRPYARRSPRSCPCRWPWRNRRWPPPTSARRLAAAHETRRAATG